MYNYTIDTIQVSKLSSKSRGSIKIKNLWKWIPYFVSKTVVAHGKSPSAKTLPEVDLIKLIQTKIFHSAFIEN